MKLVYIDGVTVILNLDNCSVIALLSCVRERSLLFKLVCSFSVFM